MDNQLVNIATLARLLKVDIRWLRKETDAGRIPHLLAGNNVLFNPSAVQEVLAEKARIQCEHQNLAQGAIP